MVFVWHTTGVKTIKEAKQKSIIMGATGAASNSVRYPTLFNNMVGTKFRIIMGYRRTNSVDLAMERGEVQGRAGATFNTMLATRADWIKDKKINILAQIGPQKERGFQNIPLLTEFATDKASRAVLQVFLDDIGLGRPYLLGPGVPADRVAALRRSFNTTMKDPALLADAKKVKLGISPTSGSELEKLVAGLVKMDGDMRARIKVALTRRDTTKCKEFTDPKYCRSKKKRKKKKKAK